MKTSIQSLVISCSIFCACFSCFAENLKIPVMVGLTGSSASFGTGELEAYTLAVEDYNAHGGVAGQQVSLQVEDTQTNQQQIVTGFRRLALNNPPIVMGPTWLGGFQAIIPIARTEKILLVTPSASREAIAPENSDWPVSFYHNSTTEIKTLAEGLNAQGFRNVALLYEQEPFAEMARKLLLSNIPSLVADVGVQGGTTNFQSVLTNLRTKKADALVIFVWDQQSLLSLLQQLRVQLPALALATVHDGEGWLENPVFKGVLPHLIHTKFVIADNSFSSRFEKRFGHPPMLTATNAYDALHAVLAAMASGKHTATEIRNYLTSEPQQTVTFGTFTFDKDGSVPSKVVVIIADGKKT